jgi:hypothetical protein
MKKCKYTFNNSKDKKSRSYEDALNYMKESLDKNVTVSDIVFSADTGISPVL